MCENAVLLARLVEFRPEHPTTAAPTPRASASPSSSSSVVASAALGVVCGARQTRTKLYIVRYHRRGAVVGREINNIILYSSAGYTLFRSIRARVYKYTYTSTHASARKFVNTILLLL